MLLVFAAKVLQIESKTVKFRLRRAVIIPFTRHLQEFRHSLNALVGQSALELQFAEFFGVLNELEKVHNREIQPIKPISGKLYFSNHFLKLLPQTIFI